MSPLWVALGAALVAFALLDELRTVLGVGRGPGPMTRLITGAVWRAASRRGIDRSPPVQAIGGGGPVIVVATVGAWFVLLWAGWSLVFFGSDRSVLDSTGASASGWQRIYFAGYSVVTLGNGYYRPTGVVAELATVAASLTGMTLITLGISYVVQVISAVVAKRSFSAQVRGLGASPEEVTENVLSGSGSTGFLALSQLGAGLTTIAQQHRAYPLLHAFRSREHPDELTDAVALLVDSVLRIQSVATPERRLPQSLKRSVTTAAEEYIAAAPPGLAGPDVRRRIARRLQEDAA
jgi:hypothetical protein